MERKELSIYQFLQSDEKTQNDAWYDWFCKDTSLPAKTKKLVRCLKQVYMSKLIDINKNYVFFKNNCPMKGPLYDDFRICDMKTGDVIFTITPKSGHTGLAEVWGRSNDFKEEIVKGSWADVVTYFKGGGVPVLTGPAADIHNPDSEYNKKQAKASL